MVTTAKQRYAYTDEKGSHLHTLDGRPLIGTSTAMGIIAKPLTWWASGLACAEFGWLHPKHSTLTERRVAANQAIVEIRRLSADDYIAKADKAYAAHQQVLRETAADGTDTHSQLQRYVLHCMNVNGGSPYLKDDAPEGVKKFFATWAIKNVKRFRWAEAHCYSEKLWTGGITDCGAELVDGKFAVIDFKRAKGAYFSHFVQAAGYAYQIAENGLFTAEGVNIVEPLEIDTLIVCAFGGKEIRQEKNDKNYTEAFESAIKLYTAQRDFDQEAMR